MLAMLNEAIYVIHNDVSALPYNCLVQVHVV